MLRNILCKNSVSYKKENLNKGSSIRGTKQNKLMLAPNFAIYGEKRSRFINNQEAS